MSNRYDAAVTRFSPSGHLFQVDYAFEAVKKGACAVGIKTKDSVIIGVERKATPKLQDSSTIKKIFQIDNHLAMACAGLTADARVLTERTVLECQQYRLTYDQPPTVNYIAKFVAKVMQRYTQVGGRRPFGIGSLIVGFDQAKEPMLYLTEPSGSYSLWKACSIGHNSKNVTELLEKKYKDGLNHDEGIKLAIEGLLEVVESGNKNMEIAYMQKDEKLVKMTDEEVKKLVEVIEKEKQPPAPAPGAGKK
jgi:20S proteasome subunit alpha 4